MKEIDDEAISRASQMWDDGYHGVEIARHLGVTEKWFQRFRKRNRELFPVRDSYHHKQLIPANLVNGARPDVMVWQTKSGAVVTLPKISFIECPRVAA